MIAGKRAVQSVGVTALCTEGHLIALGWVEPSTGRHTMFHLP